MLIFYTLTTNLFNIITAIRGKTRIQFAFIFTFTSAHSQGLTEAKKQNHDLIERVQAMQNELSDSEVRRAELETQIRQSHTLLVQRQEQEQELNKKLQKVSENRYLQKQAQGAVYLSLGAPF